MHTTKQWWSTTKANSDLLIAWLEKQYHGEVTAADRIEKYAMSKAKKFSIKWLSSHLGYLEINCNCVFEMRPYPKSGSIVHGRVACRTILVYWNHKRFDHGMSYLDATADTVAKIRSLVNRFTPIQKTVFEEFQVNFDQQLEKGDFSATGYSWE